MQREELETLLWQDQAGCFCGIWGRELMEAEGQQVWSPEEGLDWGVTLENHQVRMVFKAKGTKKVTQKVTVWREDPDPGLPSPPALTCSLGGCGAGVLSVLGGTGGAGPRGPHILWRAGR